jgi:multidrug efflux pump subunit AcrA (membrane-fusion protein)
MSKNTEKKLALDVERSPERAALAAAIARRDAAGAQDAALAAARERAKADAFLARRDVENAERALARAREETPVLAVDAYIDGAGEDNFTAIAEAEAALQKAQRRAAELGAIERELSARTGPMPGRSIPGTKVDAAVRDVVRACPTVRRLAQDFDTVRRAFAQYHSTLRWLAANDCIPDDLKAAAPKPHETYHADPDPAWIAALEALKRDANAELPE